MADPESRDGAYNYKTLLCTNVPELFLDKYIARTHFGRFGNLVNFVLRPQRMTCTVSYATEEEAELALNEGNIYNGHEFQISYAEMETAPAQKTEQWVDPDVQAELSALSSGWKNEKYPSGGKSMKPLATGPMFGSSLYKQLPVAAAMGAPVAPAERRERAPSQFKAAKQELETIMRKPAYTSEEKWRLLDARDKWMRLNQQQGNHLLLTAGKATQGYCPDMCPEKERALREFQRQVAVYELQPNTDDIICHKLAIKQYSRSSADQETPLAHELRGEPALHMTMCYLMHEIMDLSEQGQTPLGDWFHFVWDRTRSIRKEITQQELCSLSAVKLVEQCARFHIHCAARLVAEDPSVFDSKINAENLTKCLQTLKYMYHDLRLKGIQCPREAEFRGYIVLLNLADANFLWDIGQLPTELQNCPEICQAIQFYLALQDTNIVRFFQLLREPDTTYLSACILVTYFTRLRVLGLYRLIQAYRAPRKHEISSLPLMYVSKLLGFPSGQEVEAAYFLQHYGLEISDTARVILTRINTPEIDYKLKRQMELVESKRYQSVGECICGEPLPPPTLYRNHRPHNSFNEQGFLKSNAWMAKDQMPNTEQDDQLIHRDDNDDNLFKVPMKSAAMLPRTKPLPLTEEVKVGFAVKPPSNSGGLGGFSFTQALENVSRGRPKASTPNMGEFRFPQAAAAIPEPAKEKGNSYSFMPPPPPTSLSSSLFVTTAPKHMEPQLPTATHSAQEEAKLAALHKEILAGKQRQAELLAKRQEENAKAKAKAEAIAKAKEQEQRQRQEAAAAEAEREKVLLRQAEEEQQRQMEKQRKLATQAEKLYEELLEEDLQTTCQSQWRLHQLTLESYNSLVDNLIQTLAKESFQKIHYKQGLMRHYWQRWRRYRRSQKQKNTLIQSLPLHFEATSSDYLLDTASAEQSLHLMRRYRQGEPCNYRQLLEGLDEQCWLKLDLWQLLSQDLPQSRPGARRFYKLIISLPAGKIGDQLEYQLDRGLLLHPIAPDENNKSNGPYYILGLSQGIALSVIKIRGGGQVNMECSHLFHANGLICLGHDQHLTEVKQRLHSLAEISQCPYIAIIIQHSSSPKDLDKALLLHDLNVKKWRLFFQRPGRLMQPIQWGIRFLASQPYPSCGSHFQQVELREFVVNNLGVELFQRLSQDKSLHQLYRDSLQFCQQIYNEAVHRLQLVAGEDLSMIPELSPELRVYVEPLANLNTNRLEHFYPNWQSPESRQIIVELLEKIKLPTLKDSPDPSKLCQWLLDYAQLSQQEEQIDSIAMQSLQLLVNGAGYLNVIELWATSRLQYILGQEEKRNNLPRFLVYKVDTLKKYFQSFWFYEFQQSNHKFTISPAQMIPPPLTPISPIPSSPITITTTRTTSPSLSLNDLDFDNVVGKALAVLERTHMRHERQTLRDRNVAFNPLEQNIRQSREKENEWNQDNEHVDETESQPKRQRLISIQNSESL